MIALRLVSLNAKIASYDLATVLKGVNQSDPTAVAQAIQPQLVKIANDIQSTFATIKSKSNGLLGLGVLGLKKRVDQNQVNTDFANIIATLTTTLYPIEAQLLQIPQLQGLTVPAFTLVNTSIFQLVQQLTVLAPGVTVLLGETLGGSQAARLQSVGLFQLPTLLQLLGINF